MKIKNTEIRVIMADITELKADVLVNAANNELLMGAGVAAAIKKKGGEVIEDEALKQAPIKIGAAVHTSAGALKAKYIIHAATMGLDHKTDEIKIRNSSRNALLLAQKLKVNSIVFPALGCGVGKFPLLASAKIMAQEVLKYLRREEETSLKEIIFCLHGQEAYRVFDKGISGYLSYVCHKLGNGPYVTVDAIIEINGGIVIIQRSNPPFGWALPGGFLDYGESLEEAVRREAKEETGLSITGLSQFRAYSDPKRDPRFHTIGIVFLAKAKGKPQAGDDAAGLKIIKLSEITKSDFAFDHKKILLDYLKYKKIPRP
jgi:O-acetyl-ADP-ribose deacetylase (regulator of RNase III)/ADP-ribose pyrophosphatase YjhB (NUDIX family)